MQSVAAKPGDLDLDDRPSVADELERMSDCGPHGLSDAIIIQHSVVVQIVDHILDMVQHVIVQTWLTLEIDGVTEPLLVDRNASYLR